ncbi:hypothetical protein JNM87_01325 [Candidatus Saccharibacteria bacterium]|nr:hypothetical protein [Candidatus Saccharibacteria bacterium]
MVKHLELSDPGAIGDGSVTPYQRAHARSRLLAIFDQLVERPEVTDAFLANPTVLGSVALRDPDLVSTIAVRARNIGASADTTAKLIAFACSKTGNPELIAGTFVRLMAAGKRIEDPSELTELLPPAIAAAFTGAIKDDLKRRRLYAEQEHLQNEARAAEAERLRLKRLKEKQDRDAEVVREQKWIDATKNDPVGSYRRYLESGDYLHDTENGSGLPMRLASTYLLASRYTQEGGFEETAINTLRKGLEAHLASVDDDGNCYDIYNAIRPHLATIIPDMASLHLWVIEYPKLASDTKYYSDWKDGYIDGLLGARTKELLNGFDVGLLIEQDIRSIEVDDARLGVRYETLEELEADMMKYFAGSIGDLLGQRLKHTAETIDPAVEGQDKPWPRPNEQILMKDMINPFKEFIASCDVLEPGHFRHFLPSVYMYGDVPYEYRSTSFADHLISFKVSNEGGSQVFYVDIKGGDRYSERFKGEALDRFAAFVGMEVSYPTSSDMIVTSGLLYTVERDEPELEALERDLRSGRQEPRVEIRDGSNKRGRVYHWQRESWDLPYEKTPNLVLYNALRTMIGDDAQVFFSASKDDEGLSIWDYNIEELPEVSKSFNSLITQQDQGSEQKQGRLIRWEDLAKFRLCKINPNQVRIVRALSCALSLQYKMKAKHHMV